MAQGSILTTIGLQKLASATPENQLQITHLAVGDGNGGWPPLSEGMTALVNEVWRGAASAPVRDEQSQQVLIFDSVIPGNVGGFTIREIGIFDADGDLIAVAQTGATEKPGAGSISPLTLTVRMRVRLSNASQVELVYQDTPVTDHQGLGNRSASDAHPIESITGLAEALESFVKVDDLSDYTDPRKGAALVGRSVRVINSLTELRTIPGRELDVAIVLSDDGGCFKFSIGTQVDDGIISIPAPNGTWRRELQRQFFSSWAGVNSENPDSSAGLQAIVDIAKTRKFVPVGGPGGVTPVVYGIRDVCIDADQVTYSASLLIDGNIELSGWSSQNSAVLNYTGDGSGIVINSPQPDDFATAPQLSQAVTVRGLHLKAYTGTFGIFCGAATFRDVQFYSGSISGVTGGTGIFMGEATYGGTLDGFDLYGCSVGLHFNDYCDLITVRNSWIGGNSQAGILVEGPTFNFENLNVEGNSGVGIQLIHREGNRNGLRAGRITGCRFGDEEWPQAPASRDIEFTVIPGVGVGAIAGTVIENNKFFTGGETPKLVPILINGPVTQLSIRGNFRSLAYSSGYLVQATAAAYGAGAMYDSYIDDITQVDPAARALFNRCENKSYARFVATSAIEAGYAVEATGYADANGSGAQTRIAAIATGDVAAQRRIIGIADYSEYAAGRPVWIRTKGALVDVAIPYSAENLNAPVYLGHGALTLAPPNAAEPFIVGIVAGEGASGNTKMLVLVG